MDENGILLCSAQRMTVGEGRAGTECPECLVHWMIICHVVHVGLGPRSEPTSFLKESCGRAIHGG